MPKSALYRSKVRIASIGVALAAATASVVVSTGSASGAPTDQPLTATTILTGTSHGWSSPDDLTQSGDNLFVSFQNGVPATGGGSTGPTQSTIVEFTIGGTIKQTWQLTGKCDGLTADPEHHRLIATVNEDGNSSLYTIPLSGGGAPVQYTYDASPLPHGGGTDSITIYRGNIYTAASNPATPGMGPALYEITLHDGIAHLEAAPFYNSSLATDAVSGSTTNLALSDPDSSTVVPRQASRFQGDFNLDAQGDQQEIFAKHLGEPDQSLWVLNLSQSVDDTAFATGRGGALITDDSSADSVVVITGTFTRGAAYTSVTPGNANNAPPSPAPNYLGVIDLATGTVNPVTTLGVSFEPHSLLYVSDLDG